MTYIGWDNREYEDLEMDNMRRDAQEENILHAQGTHQETQVEEKKLMNHSEKGDEHAQATQ